MLYAEARGEPLEGQKRVAETVLNRVEHPSFPNSVCDVVNQPGQYSLSRNPADHQAWEQVQAVARDTLSRPETSSEATHFYSGGSKPGWAKNYRYEGQVGGHKFYAKP